MINWKKIWKNFYKRCYRERRDIGLMSSRKWETIRQLTDWQKKNIQQLVEKQFKTLYILVDDSDGEAKFFTFDLEKAKKWESKEDYLWYYELDVKEIE